MSSLRLAVDTLRILCQKRGGQVAEALVRKYAPNLKEPRLCDIKDEETLKLFIEEALQAAYGQSQ